jgi:olefin beta-lactone synthetase
MLSDDAEIVVFYGATEALPVAVISAEEMLGEAEAWATGAGTCLGRPLETMKTAVIAISDEPLPEWDPTAVLAPGEIGELAVSGSVVSAEYSSQPRANELAKMRDPHTGELWHRMGDVVREDPDGRLWFQGRIGHRVRTASDTLYTVPTEAIFNQHREVKRTALVGVGEPGSQLPVLCVEMEPGCEATQAVREELLELGGAYPRLAVIQDILFHEGFPVDIRHNSKIFSEKLAVWATEQLVAESPASA